jgi:hypothetical protein
MCSLRFENNLLSSEGVRFASISKKTLFAKLSFAFVLLALPLLVHTLADIPQKPVMWTRGPWGFLSQKLSLAEYSTFNSDISGTSWKGKAVDWSPGIITCQYRQIHLWLAKARKLGSKHTLLISETRSKTFVMDPHHCFYICAECHMLSQSNRYKQFKILQLSQEAKITFTTRW